MKRILIAGIGNIFFGDDAFGVEVVRELQNVALPDTVQVVDFGIRSYDLAYAISDGYDAVIFIDAASRGEKPGTLWATELNLDKLDQTEVATNGHSLNPIAVLQMVRRFEVNVGRLFLIGCEPSVLEREDGLMELSPEVAAAVPQAVKMIKSLLNNLDLSDDRVRANEKSGFIEAATEKEKSYAVST